MVSKISLLKISADAVLLECKCTAQEFIIATDPVFFKAQDLAMLAPLHEMVFGLLEGLLDNWHLLNLDSVEWKHKAENLNKQVPWCAEFGKTVLDLTAPVMVPKTVVDLMPTPALATSSSTLPPTQEQPSQQVAPCNKGKGKAKVTEKDEDEEGEAAQRLRKELEDFMVLTKSKGCLWNGIGIRMQKKRPPLEALAIAKCVKIKHEHIEELIGTRKGKEIIELEDLEEETVAPKTPMAGPLCQTLKPMVLVPSMPKPISKPIIALASLVAGPSTA
ncbi:hypothetical protein C0995_000813 [Termitomyces sp. Mi166|nr:hypothetical protein C0995_000813 [Termitomyces sp. Mi166\